MVLSIRINHSSLFDVSVQFELANEPTNFFIKLDFLECTLSSHQISPCEGFDLPVLERTVSLVVEALVAIESSCRFVFKLLELVVSPSN